MDKEIFYLKVNRMEGYTIRNLKKWLRTVSLYEDAKVFILCDKEELKEKIEKECYLKNMDIMFIESAIQSEPLKYIIRNVVNNSRWDRAAYAHLTTFLHANQCKYKEYWNIDADDTRFCLSPERTKELLDVVKKHAKENSVKLFSLDMWASFYGTGKHWTFGVTYTDNTLNWIEIMKKHCVSKEYNKQNDIVNIDNFFRYLKNETQYSIESFYFENLKFFHYSNDFFFRTYESGLMHWLEGVVHYPIIEYCFGLKKAGQVPIDANIVRLDINISNEEAQMEMLEECDSKEMLMERTL